ncbi:MAG: DNA repair protein RadC [Syntrophobacteraceae bacterium]|jgi:DNA repair protein RadC|nr:DNA repair protein RadC [Syntrophobacteraceae bacterium]
MNEGHRQRLRERFEQSGLHGFHDHEVIELLLSYAIPRRDVKPLAKELIARFGSLSAVVDAPLAHLREIDGVGSRASVLLTMLPRLMDRYLQDRWKRSEAFHSTQDAVRYLYSLLGTERSEVFYILALNSQNALIAAEEIQRGSVNRTAVFPRLVVEACLKHRATAVILAHNHPGGDPHPSSADRQLTRRLKRLLNDLDIQVHDHIIVAGQTHHSFAEHQELE